MKLTPKTSTKVVGISIELNSDEIAALSVALHDYIRLMKEYRNLKGSDRWEWVERLSAGLEEVRNNNVIVESV
jgi:hypothetical protein